MIKKSALKKFIEKGLQHQEQWMTEDYLLGREYILTKLAFEFGIKIKEQCSVKGFDGQNSKT